MKYKGVENGTITGEPLCPKCRYALIQRSANLQEEVYCTYSHNSPIRMVNLPVECNRFLDATHPTKWEMEEIAWVFVTKPKIGGKIGFVSPLEYKNQKQSTPVPTSCEEDV